MSRERILVINTARIGDTLLVTPVLHAIKAARPACELSVLAHPKRLYVLRHLPGIDHLGGIDKRRASWRARLAGTQAFDYALVYGHDAPLLRYANRSSKRVLAFRQQDERLNTLFWHVQEPPRAMHAVDERALLLAPLGIPLADRRLGYQATAAEQQWAQQWLTGEFGAAPGPRIGFQLRSFPTKAYRDWPLENFLELAKRLRELRPDARFLLLGGPDDRAACEAARSAIGTDCTRVAAGRLALRQSAAVMSHLRLYLGVDTGPTHLAGALSIPMVGLYHCRHPGRYLQPLEHPRGIFIEHPATSGDCPRQSPMSAITVDTVWEAVQQLL